MTAHLTPRLADDRYRTILVEHMDALAALLQNADPIDDPAGFQKSA